MKGSSNSVPLPVLAAYLKKWCFNVRFVPFFKSNFKDSANHDINMVYIIHLICCLRWLNHDSFSKGSENRIKKQSTERINNKRIILWFLKRSLDQILQRHFIFYAPTNFLAGNQSSPKFRWFESKLPKCKTPLYIMPVIL